MKRRISLFSTLLIFTFVLLAIYLMIQNPAQAAPWAADSQRGSSLQAANEFQNCKVFPIAIHESIRSVTPPGEGGLPYPEAAEFEYPDPPPAYESFINHTPSHILDNAQEGDVFFLRNGFGAGNFGWLLWNQGRPANANTLATSLTWPGDNDDYTGFMEIRQFILLRQAFPILCADMLNQVMPPTCP